MKKTLAKFLIAVCANASDESRIADITAIRNFARVFFISPSLGVAQILLQTPKTVLKPALYLEIDEDGDGGESHNPYRISEGVRGMLERKRQVHSEESRDDDQGQRHRAVDSEHLHYLIGAVGNGGEID